MGDPGLGHKLSGQNWGWMRERQCLKFRLLASLYGIVRLAADASVPAWATAGEFISISRSSEELSIVCAVDRIPNDIDLPHRWACLKIEGPFAFSQTGVLLSFIEPLSNNEVPIFAISTYDTDYVLIQEEFQGRALNLLQGAGHELLQRDASCRKRLNN